MSLFGRVLSAHRTAHRTAHRCRFHRGLARLAPNHFLRNHRHPLLGTPRLGTPRARQVTCFRRPCKLRSLNRPHAVTVLADLCRARHVGTVPRGTFWLPSMQPPLGSKLLAPPSPYSRSIP